MTEAQYRSLTNFSWNERDIRGRLLRDQLEALNYEFVWRLDLSISDAKSYYGQSDGQFIVYDFTLDTHSSKGYHPKGRAGDGVFKGINLYETFILMDRWRFGGFGLYPDTKPHKIIHVDDRNYYRASRWVCRKRGLKNEYIYSPIVFADQLEIELEG